jgi:hypothetical protein
MRKALNENPVVRAVVIGIMALLVAFLLFTRVLNRDSGAETEPVTDTAATEAGAAPAPADPAASAEPPAPEAAAPAPATPAAPVAPEATAPAPTGASGSPAGNFLPGPGLPEDVVVAYARNKAIALFIAKPKGLDDQALALSVSRLEARGDVETFLVPVKDVAKYARITEGVDLNRTPALVIIRPRKLTDNVPEATISYGFRGPESVMTAVDDALYDGKDVTYDP